MKIKLSIYTLKIKYIKFKMISLKTFSIIYIKIKVKILIDYTNKSGFFFEDSTYSKK